MDWCFVGVDSVHARDPSAVAVVECAEVLLRLRHLERMVKITRSGELAGRCTLVVDATGAGRPVVDLLKRERPGCLLMPVIITGRASETKNGDYYGVPKRDLVTGMQVLLQSGGLQIAAGNTQFGAWREGAHDDLVLAVALACWGARKMYPQSPYGDAVYWKRTAQGRLV